MRYAEIRRKEQKCQDYTTLTVEEFESLVPVFEEEFQEYMKTYCLDGKERKGRRYVTYSNCPLPTAEDRLLFILSYVKTNNLQVIHGELFKMSQSKANQWIHALLPVLLAALRKGGYAPARSMDELAHRLGQHALLDISSTEVTDDGLALDALSEKPDECSEKLNNISECSISFSEEEKDLATSPPLFAMMAQKGEYSGPPMMRSRKSITVERKRLTR
jgi:hypothetical protein